MQLNLLAYKNTTSEKQNWLNSFFAVTCLFTCLFFSGCQEPTTAVATPRDSEFEPQFFDGTEVDANSQSQVVDSRFSFLSSDHFGCISINVANVVANEGLSSVKWQDLEAELTQMLGSNGEIKNLDRVWILLDNSLFAGSGSGSESSTPAFVIETKNEVDVEQLQVFEAYWNEAKEELAESGNEDVDADFIDQLAATKIGPNRIAISSESKIERLIENQDRKTSNPGDISTRLAKLDLNNDVVGSIVFEPLADMLSTMLKGVSTFAPDLKRFEALPEDLETLDFTLSLKDQQMMVSEFALRSETFTREIATLVSNGINDGGGGGGAFGAPGMMPGAGMFGASGKSSGSMYEPLATEVMAEVGEEIRDNGLFNVESEATKIKFRLDRPSQMDELIRVLSLIHI